MKCGFTTAHFQMRKWRRWPPVAVMLLGWLQPCRPMQVLPEVVLVAGLVAAENQEVEGQREGKGPGQARNLRLLDS